MNPSVGKVEAFGLLAGDVWAPGRPSYLYNTFFNMAGSHPYSFIDDDVEGESETDEDDGAVEWSHLIDIIDDLLEEEDSDRDEAASEEPADKEDSSIVNSDVVFPELPKPDDATAAGENPDDPADDGKTTGEETPGTTFCSTTLAVAVPALVSPSEDCAAATGGGTRRRSSSSTQRRGGRRKKAPSLSLGTGNGESSSTTKLDTPRADACKGLAGDLGRLSAEEAAAAPPAPRRSTARIARGRIAETRLSDGSGKSCYAPES